MGNLLHLDCFAGISGDMLLGALLDLDPQLFPEFREKALPLAEGAACDIALGRAQRAVISAAKVTVSLHDTGGHSARSAGEILERVRRAEQFSAEVRQKGEKAFSRLFEAEASVHGEGPHEIHLHEAGAADALIDILGAFHLIELLGVSRVTCTPLNIGGGFVECHHGTLPVPAPAAAALLKGMPVYSAGPAVERVTPTGAAILRALAPEFIGFPRTRVHRIGYGAGDRDTPGFPNVLRAFLGEAGSEEEGATAERIVAVEATIDDMNGQVAGYFLERALALGAVDVYFTPIFMKKNRPATKITCLCPPDRRQVLSRLFFEESTTLGLRFMEMDRLTLARETRDVTTPWGRVRIKVGRLGGRVVNYHPEYDDCAAIARASGIPLKRVQAEAVAVFLRLQTDEPE